MFLPVLCFGSCNASHLMRFHGNHPSPCLSFPVCKKGILPCLKRRKEGAGAVTKTLKVKQENVEVPLVTGWAPCVTFAFSSAAGHVPLQSPRGSPAKLSITWTLRELICLHVRSSSFIKLLIPWRGRRDNIQQLVISSFPSVPHTECQFKKKLQRTGH